MKKYIIILSTACLILLSGCEKHLSLTPVSYITTASFWHSEDDVQGALNGVYYKLRGQAPLNLFIWGEARSEMMERSHAGSLGYEYYYDNNLSSEHPGPSWDLFYTIINQCNLLIKYVPTIEFKSEDKKNNVLAQAYTMRAFAYYTMVRVWGGVPLRDEPLEAYDPMTIQKPRTPKEDIFKLIKEDLENALSLYPDMSFETGRNKWSKASAYALKGDVYLWTGKVENGGSADIKTALDALEEVKKADVQLVDKFGDIFKYANKGNKEILMAIRFFKNESGEMTLAHNMYMSSTGDVPSYVPADLVSKVSPPKAGNGNVWRITELVRNQFTDDDSRKAATYIDLEGNGQYYTNYGMKFNGMVENGVRYFLDDWIIYRYADVLLMIAEAKNALGQDPTEEINQVRERAYGTNYERHIFVNGTKEANDEKILKERLLELALEGHRWWDLVRFNEAFNLVPSLQGRESEKHLVLWPLSKSTLSKETLVEQTPGYE